MESALFLAQILISLLLIGAILVQQRGSGLSGVFGGEGTVYHTRRGVEKTVFKATIVLAVLFVGTAVATIVIR